MVSPIAYAIGLIVTAYSVIVLGIVAFLPEDIRKGLKVEVLGYFRTSWSWIWWFSTTYLVSCLFRFETVVLAAAGVICFAIYRWVSFPNELEISLLC